MKLNKNNFQQIVEALGYNVIPEYRFCDKRKFRADWMVTKKDLKLGERKEVTIEHVLVEYEGICGSAKSRHTSIVGYTKDTEKYNIATCLGYRVLRYTAKNFNNVIKDLEEIFV